VDLLRDGGHRGNKQIEHYLELLQQSGQTLLNHVNDVLDIAQLEAAGITLTQAPFDLDALLQRVIAPMEVAASARNNRLQLETHPDQLGYVIGDEKRLHQVFLNLIGNAIKFTENGDICVTVSTRSGKDDGKVRLEVQVQDTGIGVAEEEQGRIFDDFVRIDDTSRSRHEGTGLGLGIARRIVTAMGGKIGVDSIPGDGSVFWFHVDLTPTDSLQTAEADAEERTQEPKKPLSILIVEDIETNRFVLREMLERDGYKVTEAVNGQEGVDAAHDTRFDLILMDISMPVMGGVEATRLIRKNGASRDSRIVAVTAHVFNQDTALFREAGMDAVVAKPITRQNMRAVLSGEGRIEPDRPGTDLIDISHLSQVLRKLGRQKVDDLISGFRTEAPELIELLEATDWHDASDIGDRVHALAGVAAMIGARQFRNMLSRLESSLTADNPQDLSGWAALLATLWGETEQALNDYLTSQG
ncbi:MAG: ATP-binding protein, partial [Ruegeria sp.]|nr:ATP-binding protein [Ruegeria sp.]